VCVCVCVRVVDVLDTGAAWDGLEAAVLQLLILTVEHQPIRLSVTTVW